MRQILRYSLSFIFLWLALGHWGAMAQTCTPGSQVSVTFNYTGDVQDFVVPFGITKINLAVQGADGGTVSTAIGGAGGMVNASFPVTPGDHIRVIVGGKGGFSFGGGGGGGTAVINCGNPANCATGTLLLVAGGGGGAYPGRPGGGASSVAGTGSTGTDYTLVYGGGGINTVGVGQALKTAISEGRYTRTGGGKGFGGGGSDDGGRGAGGGGGYSGGNASLGGPTEFTTGGTNYLDASALPGFTNSDGAFGSGLSRNGQVVLSYTCPNPCDAFIDGIAYVAPRLTSGDGTSWATAFKTLQEALTAANKCASITQIWVAKGTYYPDEGGSFANNDRNASFTMKNNLAIYGGFDGTEASNYDLSLRNFTTNETILSGDLDQNDNPADFANHGGNSFNVVTSNLLNNSAVLSGFTIKGGFANGQSTFNYGGGGMHNNLSSPIVANCSFYLNYGSYGGAMHNWKQKPVIQKCNFRNNRAQFGGAIWAREFGFTLVSESVFDGNGADYSGGAIYNNLQEISVTNCYFSNNSASQGGAIYNGSSLSPKITNCAFLGNTASQDGGAMYNADFYGGNQVYTITNCTFANNNVINKGSVFFNANTTITAVNCILWGNGGEAIFNTSFTAAPVAVANITYSIVQGGHAGTGNISSDPLFVSASDLHLTGCSPALDAGNDAANTTANDLDGNPRKFDAYAGGALIDMGAYEFQSPGTPLTTYYTDADGDGYGTGDGQEFCNNPGAGWAAVAGDCNDDPNAGGAAINPGATEVCDGIDNNCDGQIDEGFTNTDGDSEADCIDADDDNDGVPDAEDCAPLDATIWRTGLLYTDADGDGYGTGTAQSICYGAAIPDGYSLQDGDCNDNNPAINPGATEVCDGIDNNCDGQTDEGFTNTDGDSEADCVDADDDNDGTPDAEDCAPLDATTWRTGQFYTDADGDGYGTGTAQSICYGAAIPNGYSLQAGDCDDNSPAVYPGATEICGNGIDDNCNGQIDEACGTCPLPQGDWKNNPTSWPANTLPMKLGTTNLYTQNQLIALMDAAVKGDASLILATQLIAAKLNVANGAAPTQAVLDAIAAADAAIGGRKLPAKVKSNSTLGNTMVTLAMQLEQYNTGLLNSGCAVAPATITMAKSQTISLPVLPTAENYPNPFTSNTTIRYTLPAEAQVQLSVFNAQGQQVALLANGVKMAGTHYAVFDGNGKASGLYLYHLQTKDADGKPVVITGKMILGR